MDTLLSKSKLYDDDEATGYSTTEPTEAELETEYDAQFSEEKADPGDTSDTEILDDDKSTPEVEEEPARFKDRSREDVISDYQELQTKIGNQGTNLSEQKATIEELQAKVDELTTASVDPETPETSEVTKSESLWSKEERDEYAKLIDSSLYDGGDPSLAAEFLLKVNNRIISEQSHVSESTRLVSEANTHNDSLGQSRARHLLYEHAKSTGNQKLMDKYGDKNVHITPEDINAFDAVAEQLVAELKWVNTYAGRQPLKTSSGTMLTQYDEFGQLIGRLPDDIFEKAYRDINYDKHIQETKIETADTLAQNMNKSGDEATFLTPAKSSKADNNIEFDGTEDFLEVIEKATDVDPQALEDDYDARAKVA